MENDLYMGPLHMSYTVEPQYNALPNHDVVVTNGPYNQIKAFTDCAIKRKKPFIFMIPMSFLSTKYYRTTFKDIPVHIQILSPPPRFTKRWFDKDSGKFMIKKDVVVGPCAWLHCGFDYITTNEFSIVDTGYKKGA